MIDHIALKKLNQAHFIKKVASVIEHLTHWFINKHYLQFLQQGEVQLLKSLARWYKKDKSAIGKATALQPWYRVYHFTVNYL